MENIPTTFINQNSGGSVKSSIHCKLTYNDQIRRFVFTGNGFVELRAHVAHLLSLPLEGFVLKYVDNESDLITLSTNEEFNLALELSDKVLRLVAENPVQTIPTAVPGGLAAVPGTVPGTVPFGPGGNECGPNSWRNRGGHPFHHHPHHMHPHGGWGRGGGGRWSQGGDRAEKFESQKMQLQMKLDMMKNALAQIPADDQSNRKYKLMMQINRLEGRLLRFDVWVEKKGKKSAEKHWKKHEKKHEKKFENYSPEILHQIQLLKAQIASLKPTLYELKTAKKHKKAQLDVALQTGSGDKEAIWQEILVLKERIAEVKKEIKPLKENIDALKGKK
jgi:hypothetical protein